MDGKDQNKLKNEDTYLEQLFIAWRDPMSGYAACRDTETSVQIIDSWWPKTTNAPDIPTAKVGDDAKFWTLVKAGYNSPLTASTLGRSLCNAKPLRLVATRNKLHKDQISYSGTYMLIIHNLSDEPAVLASAFVIACKYLLKIQEIFQIESSFVRQ